MDGRTAAAVLGISQGATRGEIRRAFRARAKLAHPDAHGTDEAFVVLRAAADLLLASAPVDAPAAPAVPAVPSTPVAAGAPNAVAVGSGPAEPAGHDVVAVVAGGRRHQWEQRGPGRPGGAIDLTDGPGLGRCRRAGATSSGATADPSAAGRAFAQVLDAELSRR